MANPRLESRKSLLGADPGFSHQGHTQYQPSPYDQNQNYQGDYQAGYDQKYDHNQHYTQDYPQNHPPAAASGAYETPGMQQPAYQEPAYRENTYMGEDFNGGYAGRQGVSSRDAPSTTRESLGFMHSKWPAAFMGVTLIQALICVAFEAYVFARFQINTNSKIPFDNQQKVVKAQYKTIPTFLTLIIFGVLYELVIVWDALRLKNTIQIIGVCIANLALLIYAALQIDQIKRAFVTLQDNSGLAPGVTADILWGKIQAFLFAMPAVIAVGTLCMGFIAWKLYREFAWDILKTIGADYQMKNRFLHYQIYIALLKFDFFFFLGFIIQFVVVVVQTSDPEFGLTIATIPITIVILLAAAWFTKEENKVGMAVILVLYLGGLAYFIFKLARMYQPSHQEVYLAVRRSMTAFAVITILLIILTIANGILCFRNFDRGLKPHLEKRRKTDESSDLNSYNMQDPKQQLGSRMIID